MENRKQGLGTRGSGFGKLIGLGMLILFGSTAYPPHLNGESAGGRPRINVRIQNYAQVEPVILSEAIREANAILQASGVEFTWEYSPVGSSGTASGCLQALRETDLVMRILPRAMRERLSLPENVFGFSLVEADDPHSFLAYVFYDRVEELSNTVCCPRPATLGRLMAHEIGHLLLGTNSHSSFGIMRELLTGRDLVRRWGFGRDQAARIRANVRARQKAAALHERMPAATAELHEPASPK